MVRNEKKTVKLLSNKVTQTHHLSYFERSQIQKALFFSSRKNFNKSAYLKTKEICKKTTFKIKTRNIWTS